MNIVFLYIKHNSDVNKELEWWAIRECSRCHVTNPNLIDIHVHKVGDKYYLDSKCHEEIDPEAVLCPRCQKDDEYAEMYEKLLAGGQEGFIVFLELMVHLNKSHRPDHVHKDEREIRDYGKYRP